MGNKEIITPTEAKRFYYDILDGVFQKKFENRLKLKLFILNSFKDGKDVIDFANYHIVKSIDLKKTDLYIRHEDIFVGTELTQEAMDKLFQNYERGRKRYQEYIDTKDTAEEKPDDDR